MICERFNVMSTQITAADGSTFTALEIIAPKNSQSPLHVLWSSTIIKIALPSASFPRIMRWSARCTQLSDNRHFCANFYRMMCANPMNIGMFYCSHSGFGFFRVLTSLECRLASFCIFPDLYPAARKARPINTIITSSISAKIRDWLPNLTSCTSTLAAVNAIHISINSHASSLGCYFECADFCLCH